MSNQHAAVIVVGAGPTGLLLASDLAEAGIAVLLLEKRSAELSNLSRAFAVHARTLETLDARGLADELLARGGARTGSVDLFGRATLRLSELRSRFPYVLVTPQYRVEAVLRERAIAAGAEIHYDTEVTGVDQDAEAGRALIAHGGGFLGASGRRREGGGGWRRDGLEHHRSHEGRHAGAAETLVV